MKRKLFRELKILIVLLVLILAFRSAFFEPYRIPSGSMIPTILIGDVILVNKAAYGVRVPFFEGLFNKKKPLYLWGKTAPERGDVVVFKFPKNEKINYVKRIVGLPGDTLEIRDKQVFINDKKIEVKEIAGENIIKSIDKKFRVYNLKFYSVMTGKHKHIIQQNEDNYYQIDFDKIEIPHGKFFVMGDNRDFSSDSRFWGLVPQEFIKGQAVTVWLSLAFPGADEKFRVRWDRFFSKID